MLQPAILPAYLSSAARVVGRRVRGPRRFDGDARAILRAIVDACWTGEYFAASGGHFRQFWTRDFGFAAPALVRLGQVGRVTASLEWALDASARHGGRVTTTIFAGRRPADVYTFGIDSLPMLLRALEAADAAGDALVGRHRQWLGAEVERYAAVVLDPQTGVVRDDRRFSTHRDTVRTGSNAYANTMVALLDAVLRRTGWFHSPIPAGAADRLIERFWRGDHFTDRADRDVPTGDANVFPFWLEVVPASLGLVAALRALEAHGLTRPLPLRYAARRDPAAEDRVQRLFVPDYQGTSIWTSLGAIHLDLLALADPAAAQVTARRYAELVERDGTLWEVLTEDLRPYRGRLGIFVADEAMLWAAILLDAMASAEGATRAPSTARSSESARAREGPAPAAP
jgi:hypothetical protein